MYSDAALNPYIYEYCTLGNIQLGDHVCAFYEEDEYKDIVDDYIIKSLESHQRVACLSLAEHQPKIINTIKSFPINFDSYIQAEQLFFVDLDCIVKDGHVNKQDFIDLYKNLCESSLEKGFSCLRLFNDMSWIGHCLNKKHDLLKLEASLTKNFYKHYPAIGLCCFPKSSTSVSLFNDLLEAYQLFYIDREIYPNNYYIPPSIMVSKESDQNILEYKIAHIKESRRREQYIASLHKQTEELKDFSHIIAHDLKGPLRRINALNDIMKTEYFSILNKTILDLQEKLSDSLKTMNDRMNGLIELTNVTHNRKSFKLLKIADLIDESLELFQEEFIKTNTKVQMNLQKNSDYLELNRDLILQLFDNIFSNCLKYRKKDQALIINIILKKDRFNNTRIYITDNGIGFNPQYKTHIFKPFHRLHSEDQYEGQGLGLTICSRIIEKHKGNIIAESQEDQGTTIILIFPVPENLSP